MSNVCFHRLLLIAATAISSSAAFGQIDIQLRARQMAGWDARAREGRCEIRVWVDNQAEVRMRGDTIFVHTLEGSKGRDEGSECSQPLPYNSVGEFQIRQTAGRNRVTLAQQPSRLNNYTATVSIDDPQGGGDNYAFEVSWRADANVASAPAPFFDDVRACQDAVRQNFVSQNGRGSYVDFNGIPDRNNLSQDQGDARGYGQRQNRNRNRGQESIHGQGSARRWNESRDMSYSCVMDTRQNQVVSAAYQYSGNSMRTNERSNDRQLR